MGKSFRKTRKMRRLEEIFGEPIDQLLRKLYIEKDMRLQQICDYFKNYGVEITPGPLSQWLARLNIPSRTWSFSSQVFFDSPGALCSRCKYFSASRNFCLRGCVQSENCPQFEPE